MVHLLQLACAIETQLRGSTRGEQAAALGTLMLEVCWKSDEPPKRQRRVLPGSLRWGLAAPSLGLGVISVLGFVCFVGPRGGGKTLRAPLRTIHPMTAELPAGAATDQEAILREVRLFEDEHFLDAHVDSRDPGVEGSTRISKLLRAVAALLRRVRHGKEQRMRSCATRFLRPRCGGRTRCLS